MSETPHADAPAIPPEWAAPREAGVYWDMVYWPLAPAAEHGWQAAGEPPVAGRRDVVVVWPDFAKGEGAFLWTPFDLGWMAVYGCDSGRPDAVDQIRMALCRHAGDGPDGFRGPEGEPGCWVIAVDILVSPSLADVARCSLAAAATLNKNSLSRVAFAAVAREMVLFARDRGAGEQLIRTPEDTLTLGRPRKAS